MFKQLLRTLPSLSGQVKLVCKIKPENDKSVSLIAEDELVCRAEGASLYPSNSSINQYGVKCGLLSSSYDWDLKEFYSIYKDTFYTPTYKFDKVEVEKLDKYAEANERDKSLEFGCRRASYSVSGSQFEFFAPIYIDNVGDIPDEFVITMSFDNGIYKVNDKSLIIKIKDIITDNDGNEIDVNSSTSSIVTQWNKNLLYNYLYKYAVRMNGDGGGSRCVQFRYNENDKGLNVSNAIYYGIDLIRGGFTSANDSSVNYLYYNHITTPSFDDTVTRGFERHNMVMKQIIPLCFSFNISDMMTKDELKRVNYSKITFRGMYRNGVDDFNAKDKTPDLYDFSINYNHFNIPRVIFDKTDLSCEYKVDDYTNDKYDVMSQSFPALSERKYWKYRFLNKISPNTTRWAILQSLPEFSHNICDDINSLYIINNNVAFSTASNESFKYGLFPSINNTIKSVCNVAAIGLDNKYYKPSDIEKYGGDFFTDNSKVNEIYNLVLPTNDDFGHECKNYDFMRATETNKTLLNYNKYKESLKETYFAVSNILYIKDECYSKKIDDTTNLLSWISNFKNQYSLDDIINKKNVFSDVDFALSVHSDKDIFDKTSDAYNSVWSTPVHDVVYNSGMLFNIESIYNDNNYIKKVQDKYAESIFDVSEDVATTALEIASKHNIQDYINEKTLENFKKTNKITKFSVFVMPIMSVITDYDGLYSASDTLTLLDSDVTNSTSNLMTYTNSCVFVPKTNKNMKFDAVKTSYSIYNTNVNTDTTLYYKSDDINLYSIIDNAYNISYTTNDDKTTYFMSKLFKQNNSYQNLWCDMSEFNKLVNDAFSKSSLKNIKNPQTNLYYSINEITNTYNKLSSYSWSSTYNKLNEFLKDIIATYSECGITSYSMLPVRCTTLMTENQSNALSYNNQSLFNKTLSYIYKSNYDNYSNQKYDNLYTYNNKVLIDGSKKYTETANIPIYENLLFSKELFVPCSYIEKEYLDEIDKQNSVTTSQLLTKYEFNISEKNSSGDVVATNFITQKENKNSGSNIYKENIKEDNSVIWCDSYNMYDVLTKFGIISKIENQKDVDAMLESWRNIGVLRDFFCSFVDKEHIQLWASNTCGDFQRYLRLYCTYYDNIKGGWCYNPNTYDIHDMKLIEHKESDKNIYYDVNKYTAYMHVQYKRKKSDTDVREAIGGPFFYLYARQKAVTLDDNVRMRSKYRYIRFSYYIKELLKEKIYETYKDGIVEDMGGIKVDDEKTYKKALESVTVANIGNFVSETKYDGLFDICVPFDVYVVSEDDNDKTTGKQLEATAKFVSLVYKKEFIRVDENIMERIFNLSGNKEDKNKNRNSDLYFSRMLKDSEFDETMYDINVNENYKINYVVLSEHDYLQDIITYNDMYKYASSSDASVLESLNDIIYRSSNDMNLEPLYNSASAEYIKSTVVYIQRKLNNIKKVRAEYESPFEKEDNPYCTNYRYASDDITELVSLNSKLIENVFDAIRDNLQDEDKSFDKYKEILESAFENITIYTEYNRKSCSLLKPEEDSEFDALGLSSQNIFTYTKDGENYGFYVVGVRCNNTMSQFNSVFVDSIKREVDETGKVTYSFTNKISNNKFFYSFDSVPLIEYENKEQKISIDGVQYFNSRFRQIMPFMKESAINTIYNINTLNLPAELNDYIKYFTKSVNYNNADEITINYLPKVSDIKNVSDIKTLKRASLVRYFTWALPAMYSVIEMEKLDIFKYIYNTKRKYTNESIIETGKYLSIGDTIIDEQLSDDLLPLDGQFGAINDINKYSGVNVYGVSNNIDVKSFNNIIETYYEPEYQHFNTSTFFLLEPSFIVKANGKYTYDVILKMSEEQIKKQIFKRYVENYCKTRYKVNENAISVPISNDEMLFLYSRYNVSITSNSIGLNSSGQRVYTLQYNYLLK